MVWHHIRVAGRVLVVRKGGTSESRMDDTLPSARNSSDTDYCRNHHSHWRHLHTHGGLFTYLYIIRGKRFLGETLEQARIKDLKR